MMPHYVFAGLKFQVRKNFISDVFQPFASDVIRVVCCNMNIPIAKIKGHGQKRHLCYTRYIIWHTLFHKHKMTKVAIGKLFNRDHATIINGIDNYEDLENDPLFKQYIRKSRDINYRIELPKKQRVFTKKYEEIKGTNLQNPYIDRPTHKL